MVSAIVSIATGGALGALARYGVSIAAGRVWGLDFPYGTVIVNVLGSFLMGVVIAGFAHIWQPSESLRLLIVTGFLGGFTTFSTFSLDFVALWERHEYMIAATYLGGSVFLSILALFAGMAVMRGLVS
ncbi:MAG: fluoride efflux transporter CrcB [Alphaproteobacteria bacterium]|nr:fluoride efflux transporter CrcB [Alphaproteobacteria bacterium]